MESIHSESQGSELDIIEKRFKGMCWISWYPGTSASKEKVHCIALTWKCPDLEYSTVHHGFIFYCFCILLWHKVDYCGTQLWHIIGNWIKEKRKWVVLKWFTGLTGWCSTDSLWINAGKHKDILSLQRYRFLFFPLESCY